MRLKRNWSLASRLAAVTLVALIAATLLNFAVTFSGPPPLRRPVSLVELLPALEGKAPVPRQSYGWVAEPVIVPTFTPQPGEQPRPATRTAIAERLGIGPEQIGFATAQGKRIGGPPGPVLEARDGFSIGMRLANGSWRVIRGAPAPLLTEWHWVTLGLTSIAALIFALLSRMVARSVVRPLDQLGSEADRVGLGRGGPITVEGPPEVMRVARAVTAMRDRLATAIEGRTAMFTAVAHDMAAPLARLRFRLAALPEATREAAERDIDELSDLIRGILALASTEHPPRAPVMVDLAALAREVAEAEGLAATGLHDGGVVLGDAAGLRRLLTNLCCNAIRYAGGGDVDAQVNSGRVEIAVRDRGPGIPDTQLERIFEPFFRLEGSRNRETAGAGLGLSIARNMAEAHGGSLIARNRAGGGAEFLLTIPRASLARLLEEMRPSAAG